MKDNSVFKELIVPKFMKVMLSIITPIALISSVAAAAPGDIKKALEANGVKKIAIIPPVEKGNYVIEFLKKEGLDSMAKVLTQQEFADSNIFNAKNFQLAVFLGHERYFQTVKSAADGDISLVEYIDKGGTLLLLGNGPLPMYYNEKNKVVESTNLLGINIVKGKDDKFGTAMGFERIPDGVKLSFSAQKELKAIDAALTDKFAFPVAGDLRWRPATNKAGNRAYIPLISVVDEKGVWFGDAAVYNSGVVYAWFRLTQIEEPNRDKIIGSLLVYASKPGLPRVENKAVTILEKMKTLAAKYKNTRIALLPAEYQAPIEMWLLKSGIQFDRLTWEDVINSKKYTPLNYPVTVYSGGEKYRQTIKVFADVDEALVKYMEDGGFFVVSSYDPWPMYMNEDNEPTYITGKLGVPICGIDDAGVANPDPKLIGFEKPKPEFTYNYLINKQFLPDLVAKIPFPSGGDTRWRPIVGTSLPKNDSYISLVELFDDDNNYYGDGVAYLHHKVSQPTGSKVVYVWHRGPDLLGADSLFHGLFAFIAEMKK